MICVFLIDVRFRVVVFGFLFVAGFNLCWWFAGCGLVHILPTYVDCDLVFGFGVLDWVL